MVTLNSSLQKALFILIGLVLFIVGIFVGIKISNAPTNQNADNANTGERHNEIKSFSWKINPVQKDEEISHSEVYVVIEYFDETNNVVLVDEIIGSCNVEDTETTLALESEQITCYYAGLGNKFRVIEENSQYLIQQKIFEETTPDNEYTPLSEFETKLIYNK